MDIFESKIFSKEQNHLIFDGQDLTCLAAKYKMPLWIFSEREISRNINELIVAFRTHHARTAVHYAAEYESDPAILQAVRKTGIDLQVQSGALMEKCLKEGFYAEQILLGGMAKSEEELEAAIENRIKAISVDSIFELKRIIKIAKRRKKRANIVLQLSAENALCQESFREDFEETGVSVEGIPADQVRTALTIALANTGFLNLKGYCVRFPEAALRAGVFQDAFNALLALIVRMSKYTGFAPRTLGIRVALPNDPGWIVKTMETAMAPEKVQVWAGRQYRDLFQNMEILLEPGKKILASAGVELCRIEGEKYCRSSHTNWLMLPGGLPAEKDVRIFCADRIDEPHEMGFGIISGCETAVPGKNYVAYANLPDSCGAGNLLAVTGAGHCRDSAGKDTGVFFIRKSGQAECLKQVPAGYLR